MWDYFKGQPICMSFQNLFVCLQCDHWFLRKQISGFCLNLTFIFMVNSFYWINITFKKVSDCEGVGPDVLCLLALVDETTQEKHGERTVSFERVALMQ